VSGLQRPEIKISGQFQAPFTGIASHASLRSIS
jgi:hypothetical protein